VILRGQKVKDDSEAKCNKVNEEVACSQVKVPRVHSDSSLLVNKIAAYFESRQRVS
jgi:hypothetical protein